MTNRSSGYSVKGYDTAVKGNVGRVLIGINHCQPQLRFCVSDSWTVI